MPYYPNVQYFRQQQRWARCSTWSFRRLDLFLSHFAHCDWMSISCIWNCENHVEVILVNRSECFCEASWWHVTNKIAELIGIVIHNFKSIPPISALEMVNNKEIVFHAVKLWDYLSRLVNGRTRTFSERSTRLDRDGWQLPPLRSHLCSVLPSTLCVHGTSYTCFYLRETNAIARNVKELTRDQISIRVFKVDGCGCQLLLSILLTLVSITFGKKIYEKKLTMVTSCTPFNERAFHYKVLLKLIAL